MLDIPYDSDCEEFETMTAAQKAAYRTLDFYKKRDLKQANKAKKQEAAAVAIEAFFNTSVAGATTRKTVEVESRDGVTIVPINPELTAVESKQAEAKPVNIADKWKGVYFAETKKVDSFKFRSVMLDIPELTEKASRYQRDAHAEAIKARDTWFTADVIYYEETAAATVAPHTNALFGAFLRAYNEHGAIELDPGDIWLSVSLMMASYIEKHAEAMRPYFVDTPAGTKKTLVIFGRDAPNPENPWLDFLEDILPEIKLNVKADTDGATIVDALEPTFSTTTRAHRNLGAGCVMNAMKHYFEYMSMMYCCGVRAVHFRGEPDDWLRIDAKITGLLARYDAALDADFKRYLSRMRIIVGEFEAAHRGQVNETFWANMMDVHRQYYGSGGQYNEWITGWVTTLFGKSGRVDSKNLTLPTVNVQIRHVNMDARHEYDVYLVGGFEGIQVRAAGGVTPAHSIFRPCISQALVKDMTSIKPLSEETLAKGKAAYREKMAREPADRGAPIDPRFASDLGDK